MLPILTPSGLKKLAILLEKLNLHANKAYAAHEQSAYSNQMWASAIGVVDLLLRHNNGTDWLKDEKIHLIRTFFAKLRPNPNDPAAITRDANIFVFNRQSYDLMVILLEFMQDFDVKMDIKKIAYHVILLAFKFSAEHGLSALQQNLRHGIRWFERSLEDQFQRSATRECLFSIQQALMNYAVQIQELTHDKVAKFSAEYNAFCHHMLEKISTFNYLHVVQGFPTKPFNAFAEIKLARGREECIHSLLKYELKLNHCLAEVRLPLVTTVFDYYKNKVVASKSVGYKKAAELYIKSLNEDLTYYLAGGNASIQFFERLNQDNEKIACCHALQADIAKIALELKSAPIANLDAADTAFFAFRCIWDAASTNIEISLRKKIDIGKLADLLDKHLERFFDLALVQYDETCDNALLVNLQTYADTFPPLSICDKPLLKPAP